MKKESRQKEVGTVGFGDQALDKHNEQESSVHEGKGRMLPEVRDSKSGRLERPGVVPRGEGQPHEHPVLESLVEQV